MIDVVSTVTGGGAQYKQPTVSRAPAPVASPPPVAQPSTPGMLRIRVDNSIDKAIIEYRSSETGEVVNQYPTEAQVKALARAAELDTTQPTVAEAPVADTAQTVTADSTAPADTADAAPAPDSSFAVTPSATATAAPAIASAPVSTGGNAGGSSSVTSTQSITV